MISWWWVKEKKKQMALVLIIATMILQFQMKGCVGCVETERMGLLQLKSYLNSLLGPEDLSILDSWSDDDPKSDCCNWERVKCSDAIGGHIVDLSLGYIFVWDLYQTRELNISLLHSFPQLKTLNISHNRFYHLFDPILGYQSFQRLENLESLDLFGNLFNKRVLPFLNAASSLRILKLRFNSLEGVFPMDGLNNLRELEELDLSYNGIEDFKAVEGLRKTKLKTLDLSDNRISETALLKGLEHLVELEVLSLSSCQLNNTRSIQVLKDMPKLQELDLRYNMFTDLGSLGSVLPSSLKVLNLRENRLSWTWTHEGYKSFQRLENLETLDFSGNYFNTSVLSFLSAARSLRFLNLRSNSLEGVFPPNGLNNFRNLEELYLSYNYIHDFEGGEGFQTPKLRTLDLTSNRFSETARLKGLEHLVNLEVLNLDRNKFNHTRSIQVLKDMPKLQELDLSGNQFADLDSLGSVLPSSLQVLILAYNHLSCIHEGYSKFCELKNLRELDLSSNALTIMPYCLGNLSRLRTLELSDNQLDGNLSAFVSGLQPELEYLSLSGNNFNGSFLFNSLVNHTRLTLLKISSKVGNIQAEAESPWVPMFQLKMLELQNFILGNTIPGFLFHQHDLSYVDLSHNKLTTVRFARWLVQNNTRLEALFLNNNLLTELQLPRRVHHGLKVLDMSRNMIYSSFEEDIWIVFPKLMYMNFSSNQFYGTIPSSLGEMKGLETLDMSSNDLSGQLPTTFWSGCYSLGALRLSNNKLQGEIFPEHANLTSLTALHLDGNNFSGSIGEGLLNSKDLRTLDLSDNKFSGMVPLWMGNMSSLLFVYMSGNQLRGPFPHQLLQSVQVMVLDISNNSYSGSILRNLDFSSLRHLRLQNNGFWGSIPDTLFKGDMFQLLDLRNNNFSGEIPNTIGEGSYFVVLLLRNNSFQGHIPATICQTAIGIMDLSHNKFNGVIPSCLGNMSFGRTPKGRQETKFFIAKPISSLDWIYTTALHLNNDVQFGFDTRVKHVVDFLTKGRYEEYQGDIVDHMYGLDLSSNQLSGEIPVEIGDLKYIKSLNLSSNRLTGSIPYNISKLHNLESLDLSNNELSGNIPSVLADLDSLGFFNVSCNNLSGEIPSKGHLLTFDERSYIGNAHLCGGPTNISCNPTRAPEESDNEEEEHSVIDMEWFYWTCGAVYISTCLALFAFLCIDTRWSQEWFYRVDLFIHHLHRFKRSALRN